MRVSAYSWRWRHLFRLSWRCLDNLSCWIVSIKWKQWKQHIDGCSGRSWPRHFRDLAATPLPMHVQVRSQGSLCPINLVHHDSSMRISMRRKGREEDGGNCRERRRLELEIKMTLYCIIMDLFSYGLCIASELENGVPKHSSRRVSLETSRKFEAPV